MSLRLRSLYFQLRCFRRLQRGVRLSLGNIVCIWLSRHPHSRFKDIYRICKKFYPLAISVITKRPFKIFPFGGGFRAREQHAKSSEAGKSKAPLRQMRASGPEAEGVRWSGLQGGVPRHATLGLPPVGSLGSPTSLQPGDPDQVLTDLGNRSAP